MGRALAFVCAEPGGARAFTALPAAAVAPSGATRRRDDEAVRESRLRWRPVIEAGAAALATIGRTSDAGVLAWSPALTLALSVDVRRAVSDLLEIHGRLDFTGPQGMTVVPRALSERVAGLPCAGSRSFDSLGGWGARAGLSFGVRARVFSLRSPFYVGLAIGMAVSGGSASGESAAYCVSGDHSIRLLGRESATIGATLVDLGGTLETGFRFGPHEEGVLSLRLLAGGVGAGEPAVRGTVLTFGWSLR